MAECRNDYPVDGNDGVNGEVITRYLSASLS
jgi:hypothetical protein